MLHSSLFPPTSIQLTTHITIHGVSLDLIYLVDLNTNSTLIALIPIVRIGHVFSTFSFRAAI